MVYTSPRSSPVHSDTNSTSLGIIFATQQLRATTIHSHFQNSIARYSFIQLCEFGRRGGNENPTHVETASKGDSNPGSLDCESGILPMSYTVCMILHFHGKISSVNESVLLCH